MNKIEEMIKELCPKGVKRVKLGEIMTIQRGASPRPIKNFMSTKAEGVHWIKIGDISPDAKYVETTTEYITKDGARRSRLLKPGDFILSNSMSFGRPYILKIEGCIHDGWISMSGFEKEMVSDYLYVVLRTNQVQDYWKMKANDGGAMSNLNADIVRDTEIPLPPLSVQREIVRVLDSFSSLQSKLEEELEARQKQMEYYREKLLTFDKDVTSFSFGSDFVLKARIGWQGLTKKEYKSEGFYYLITGTDFIENNKIDFEHCVYVDKERYDQDENIQIKNGDVLLTKDGTLGKVAYVDSLLKPATLNGGVFVARCKDNSVVSKYLMFYLTSNYFKDFINKNHTNGSIMHLTQKLLVNFNIPVPSLSRQQEIVSTLDTISSLIDNLKTEIELRKSQYEYYREKLLTFE